LDPKPPAHLEKLMSDAPNTQKTLKDRVAEVVGRLRTMIQAGGGDLELVDVNAEGIVSVRLHGACRGCPGAQMTLKNGVERMVRQHVPEIKEVVCVRD
jgi:Fe-S cluster biogenesis protein NfuA